MEWNILEMGFRSISKVIDVRNSLVCLEVISRMGLLTHEVSDRDW